MFETITAVTTPFAQQLPHRSLRCGDLIKASGMECVVAEIYGDGISVRLPDGSECGLEPEAQFVVRRVPDHLEEWVFLSLLDGEPIRCDALENRCWKCGFVGRAVALRVGTYLVTDGRSVFRYPGVRRQLREFFAARPDVRAKFGAVKKRFSRTTGRSDLSQGCAECDALWGAFPLGELYRSYVTEADECAAGGKLIPAFEVEIARLFEEGELPQRQPVSAGHVGRQASC